jgi:hypothetical protein
MCVFCLLMCPPFKLSSQNFTKLGMNIVPLEGTQIPFRRDKLSTFRDPNVTDTRMCESLASLATLKWCTVIEPGKICSFFWSNVFEKFEIRTPHDFFKLSELLKLGIWVLVWKYNINVSTHYRL